MKKEDIRKRLFSMADKKYRDFSSKLMPTVDKSKVIGVRVPALRAFARELAAKAYKTGDFSDLQSFLSDLPHEYFEENNLHAFIVSQIKSFPECIKAVEEFLPFVDNWATCDSFRPVCFAHHKKELLPYINKWIASGADFTVRFGVEMLMVYFLDDEFSPEYPDTVSKIRSNEYYVNMMVAWYFATALAKQYESVIPYIERGALSPWVHNKTIQKGCESFRISKERKAYLKSLKTVNI